MSEIGNYRPLADRIIAKKIEKEDDVTSTGIHVVSHEKNDKTKWAEVVAVGPGKFSGGNRIPVAMDVGDTILYNGMYGSDIGGFHTSNNNEYIILHEEDVIGVISE